MQAATAFDRLFDRMCPIGPSASPAAFRHGVSGDREPTGQYYPDIEILEMAVPLTLAQEIVAVEAAFRDWAALKAGVAADSLTRPHDISRLLSGESRFASLEPSFVDVVRE
jgi:hypothetical protein